MTDLEQALRRLDVEWPATPNLAAAVGERLAAEPAPRQGRRRLAGGWRARLAAVAAAVLVLAGGALAVSPDARSTVLRWLGLKSVEIKREPLHATPGPRSSTGGTLGLGDPRPVTAARHVPAALGAPDHVYATTLPDGTRAESLIYAPRAGLPPSDVTGVALLVQTFPARVQPFIEKTVASADRVERLTVDRDPAYWLVGAHGFAFTTTTGTAFEEQRVADSTLLVERRDGLLVRIEGDIARARAVAIAHSVH